MNPEKARYIRLQKRTYMNSGIEDDGFDDSIYWKFEILVDKTNLLGDFLKNPRKALEAIDTKYEEEDDNANEGVDKWFNLII